MPTAIYHIQHTHSRHAHTLTHIILRIIYIYATKPNHVPDSIRNRQKNRRHIYDSFYTFAPTTTTTTENHTPTVLQHILPHTNTRVSINETRSGSTILRSQQFRLNEWISILRLRQPNSRPRWLDCAASTQNYIHKKKQTLWTIISTHTLTHMPAN